MSSPEPVDVMATLKRWTAERQRVTDERRSGHVIGYAGDGQPFNSRAQVEIATGHAEWFEFWQTRELGLRAPVVSTEGEETP